MYQESDNKFPASRLGQLKLFRMAAGLTCSLLCLEALFLVLNFVSEVGCGVMALIGISRSPFPGVFQAIRHIFISQLSFLVSRCNIVMLMSVCLITAVHGSQATVDKKIPSKRYQIVSQFLNINSVVNILLMGLGSAALVYCVVNIALWRFVVSTSCEKIDDSLKYIDVECVNEKNVFILVLVMIVNICEYVLWQMSNMYVLKFYHLRKSIWDHLLYCIRLNWKLPIRRCLLMFPMTIFFFKLIIQTFGYHLYFGSQIAFLEGAMSNWMQLLDLGFIMKTIVCLYISLAMFYCQWICLNLFLIEKPNANIHSIIPDANAVTNLTYITSTDAYIQTLGWFDLVSGTKNQRSKLKSLFVLSHPGNRPNIWNNTLNECIRIGNEMIAVCNEFITSRNSGSEAQSNNPQIAHAGGLTIYQFAAPNFQNGPNNVRQRLIGRDLSANMVSEAPVVTESTQFSFWETIMYGPIIMVKLMLQFTKFSISKNVSQLKDQTPWAYWFESDFELEFKNVLAQSSTMILAIDSIVEAVFVAMNSGAANIIQQDIHRINKLFIDIHEVLEKLGKLVPKKTAKIREGGEYIEVYSDLKVEHNRLLNVIKFEASKYYEHVSPYFRNISMSDKMLNQLRKITEDVETSGVEYD